MVEKTEEVEFTEDEQEELAYLAAFAAENKDASADEEEESDGVSGKSEASPDDEVQEKGGNKPLSNGTASDGDDGADDDPYAWINDLPQEAQKRAKELQHSATSDAGRVAALQRRADAAEARLQAVKSAQTKRRSEAPADGSAPKEDRPLSPKLKEFVESYPQLAESVQEMVRQDRAELEEMIDQRLSPINEEAEFRKISEARNRLEEGAAKIFDTAHSHIHYSDVLKSDLYTETFLKSQPQEFQQMAMTTQDPDTALWVLQQFATFAKQYAEDNGLMEEDDNGSGNVADKTSARRRSSKATSRTVTSRSAVTDPDDSVDYEAYFKRINS